MVTEGEQKHYTGLNAAREELALVEELIHILQGEPSPEQVSVLEGNIASARQRAAQLDVN